MPMTNQMEIGGSDWDVTHPKDMECDKASHFIKCIFFCKFHATAGPQIVTQVPNNYISKDVFDTISQYMIPKAQLQRCFVSVYVIGSMVSYFVATRANAQNHLQLFVIILI